MRPRRLVRQLALAALAGVAACGSDPAAPAPGVRYELVRMDGDTLPARVSAFSFGYIIQITRAELRLPESDSAVFTRELRKVQLDGVRVVDSSVTVNRLRWWREGDRIVLIWPRDPGLPAADMDTAVVVGDRLELRTTLGTGPDGWERTMEFARP